MKIKIWTNEGNKDLNENLDKNSNEELNDKKEENN